MSAKVILRHCATYDPNLISRIVLEGLDELDVQPRGRTLIKPNAVIAHPKYFAHAFTRSEFLDGVLEAVGQRDEAITDLTVGERCGITIPTRYSFANTKYPAVIRKHGAHTAYFDEELQVERRLLNPHALRESIYIPQTVARAEFMINLPKLKAHPWTKMTCALKNYIGIQDDRHRLIDHDFGLNHKIVDLQEVIHSDFIAVDAYWIADLHRGGLTFRHAQSQYEILLRDLRHDVAGHHHGADRQRHPQQPATNTPQHMLGQRGRAIVGWSRCGTAAGHLGGHHGRVEVM